MLLIYEAVLNYLVDIVVHDITDKELYVTLNRLLGEQELQKDKKMSIRQLLHV